MSIGRGRISINPRSRRREYHSGRPEPDKHQGQMDRHVRTDFGWSGLRVMARASPPSRGCGLPPDVRPPEGPPRHARRSGTDEAEHDTATRRTNELERHRRPRFGTSTPRYVEVQMSLVPPTWRPRAGPRRSVMTHVVPCAGTWENAPADTAIAMLSGNRDTSPALAPRG